MSDNIRILTTNDFQVVQGDSLLMGFTLENFDPTTWFMTFGIKDPLTGDLYLFANGSTYSKKHNDAVAGGEGIYYTGDINLPSGVTLKTVNDIAIKLDQADTLLLDGNQTYDYDVQIANISNSITSTIIRGTINVQSQETGNA